MTKINIPLSDIVARRDFNSRVALEFYRGDKWSAFLAFEPNGLQKFREPTAKFEATYYRTMDMPPERIALTLLRSLHSAYLPGDGVAEILLEIYVMAKTNNTDLNSLDVKGLLEIYNELAVAAGKQELKSFKESKAKLVARIEALQADVAQPTKKQTAAKEVAAARAEKRLEGLAAKKEADGKKADKPATDKPAAPKADTGGRGKGIGAFCMELIKAGKTNAEVLTEVKSKFPNASTSASSVAWYRNKLKTEGAIA